jgi:hypothetical protein
VKFFKYCDPFSALIAASSKDESDTLYGKEIVCEDGTEFPEEKAYKSHEIPHSEAHHMFWNSVRNEEFIPSFDNEVKKAPCVLLVDSELC